MAERPVPQRDLGRHRDVVLVGLVRAAEADGIRAEAGDLALEHGVRGGRIGADRDLAAGDELVDDGPGELDVELEPRRLVLEHGDAHRLDPGGERRPRAAQAVAAAGGGDDRGDDEDGRRGGRPLPGRFRCLSWSALLRRRPVSSRC